MIYAKCQINCDESGGNILIKKREEVYKKWNWAKEVEIDT